MSTATLPLQPGCIRLMLIWDTAAIRIIDAEVFTGAAEAALARANLRPGLDGEFRDYPVSLPGFVSAASLREELETRAATEQELGDDYSETPGETALEQAHFHFGRAEALRDVLKYIDRETETQR